MRIINLPQFILKLPVRDRVEQVQLLVNEALHSRNICPVGQYMAGPRVNILSVRRTPYRHYYVSSNWDEDRGLERIAVEHIEKVCQRCSRID